MHYESYLKLSTEGEKLMQLEECNFNSKSNNLDNK